MSYLKRYPPQGGRRRHLHVITGPEMPDGGPPLAFLLWSNGITAIADLRPQPDLDLKENVEQYGVAYGHIPASETRVRLQRAEQLYHTLVIASTEEPDTSGTPCIPLPCNGTAPA